MSKSFPARHLVSRTSTTLRRFTKVLQKTRERKHPADAERRSSLSKVLLLSLFGLDGVQDGLPFGQVALTDLLNLLLHLRVQRGETVTQLLHWPRTHLHTHTHTHTHIYTPLFFTVEHTPQNSCHYTNNQVMDRILVGNIWYTFYHLTHFPIKNTECLRGSTLNISLFLPLIQQKQELRRCQIGF